MTEVINKVNPVIFENQNKEVLKVYDYQLHNFFSIRTELHDIETDKSEMKIDINFCTDQTLRAVSINNDSIMKFYISNRKEREDKIFQGLSNQSAKSRGSSKSSGDIKGKSKSKSLCPLAYFCSPSAYCPYK